MYLHGYAHKHLMDWPVLGELRHQNGVLKSVRPYLPTCHRERFILYECDRGFRAFCLARTQWQGYLSDLAEVLKEAMQIRNVDP